MPSESAYNQGLQTTSPLGRDEPKRLGQFMTPVPIATFMAAKAVAVVSDKVVRVLEPAAGSGVLVASVSGAAARCRCCHRESAVLQAELTRSQGTRSPLCRARASEHLRPLHGCVCPLAQARRELLFHHTKVVDERAVLRRSAPSFACRYPARCDACLREPPYPFRR